MNNPDIILDQFVENGKRFTYMTKFFNKYDDGRLRSSVAVFKIKVKIKDNRNFLQRLFSRSGIVKYCSKHFFANQLHTW